jgi:beta-glucosidase
MGVTFVKGLQGDDPHYLKLVATPKHFAVHSGPEAARHYFNATASQRDLLLTYLPAFEATVREAGACSVMGAYNRTNGEPCCASPTLLQKTLRDQWGFAGYVVSDCWAIGDIYKHHRVVDTVEEAAALAVRAGCDLNCGEAYGALLIAERKGLISEAEIDRAVSRLFTARFRLGMFDPPERVPYAQIPISVNDSDEHRALALQAARESIVLLKNAGPMLPLSKDLHSIAVIGPNADDPQVLLGNYNGAPSRSVTPLEGLRRAVGAKSQVSYTPGCDIIDDGDDGYAAALAAAEKADVVLFFGGISQRIEGEEGQEEGVGGGMRSKGDRTDLDLPAVQQKLLEALHATGKPVILVLLNGSAISVNWADKHLPAIVEAWYAGEETGTAIAEVLFGDYNPAGRLPVTFYRSAQDLPPFEDYAMEGRTYRYFRGEPLYPFGHGLSYTEFAYSDLDVESDASAGRRITVHVTVQNTGQRPGEEVVQVYVADLEASYPVPRRQLAGFARIHLDPGQATRLTFEIAPEHLCVVTHEGQFLIEPGEFLITVGGRQPLSMDQPDDVRGPIVGATFRIDRVPV